MAAVGLPVWAPGVWADTVWAAGVWAESGAVSIAYVDDMNTRLRLYLEAYYSISGSLTPLVTRYLNEQTSGDRTQKMKMLIQAATDAMAP
jgi:hypothetical protein